MKKIIFYILIFFIMAFVFSILIQRKRNYPFYIVKSLKLQERLSEEPGRMVFRVNFLGFSPLAGIAEMENRGIEAYRDGYVYHLSAEARTAGIIPIFFNPKVRLDTYIDKDNLYSLKFSQALTIPGKPVREKEILYDQKNNIMEIMGLKRQILPGTQDSLSAIFYIQHQNFELTKEFDININTNQKNYRLYAKVIRKEEYTIADKKIGIWVLEGNVRRRDKNSLRGYKMSMWLLDNPSKTPILIKFTTKIGFVKARLIKIE